VKFNTPFNQLRWKRGRMWSFLFTALNCLIRNEPGITPAACVAPTRVRPASDVALVLIRHAERESIDVDLSVDGKVKNVFVTVVQKSFRADRFEVPIRPYVTFSILNRDRFDPVDRVLQNEQVSQLKNNFVRKHRVGRCCANVEEKGAGRFENATNLSPPSGAPIQIGLSILAVGIFSILNAEVVRRRRDDKIDRFLSQPGHRCDAILETQIEPDHGRKVTEQIRFVQEKVAPASCRRFNRPRAGSPCHFAYCLGDVG